MKFVFSEADSFFHYFAENASPDINLSSGYDHMWSENERMSEQFSTANDYRVVKTRLKNVKIKLQ